MWSLQKRPNDWRPACLECMRMLLSLFLSLYLSIYLHLSVHLYFTLTCKLPYLTCFALFLFGTASGCLLPSLPSDATYDTTGVGFVCDLNDHIPAPWPSTSQVPTSSCNRSMCAHLRPLRQRAFEITVFYLEIHFSIPFILIIMHF